MPRLDLLEPLLSGGVRHPNYFDGRVLTAEALTDEQAALHRHVDRLGRAVGEGVAFGLGVTPGPVRSGVPTVEVAPGLAVNRKGQTLAIPEEVGPVEVALSREPRARDLPEGTGLFEVCRPEDRLGDDGFQAKLDPGPYALVIGPLSAYEGRVPGVGAGGSGVATFCGSRHATEGVYLRLVALDLAPEVAGLVAAGVRSSSLAERTRARNVLAHHCLGTPDLGALRASPRTAGASYGLLDAMRAGGDLDVCEVPLALLFWDDSVLRFVDTWAVRRRLAEVGASDQWRLHALPRRLVEAEAAFLQFQDQVEVARAASGGFRLGAVAAFRYLPSAGYVPAAAEGVFFEGIGVRRRLRADEAFLRALLHDAFHADPIDLAADPRPEVDVHALPSSGLVLFVRAADVEAAGRPTAPQVGTGRLVVTVDLDPDERPDRVIGANALTLAEQPSRSAPERASTGGSGRSVAGGVETLREFSMITDTASIRGDAADTLTDRVNAVLVVDAVHRETGATVDGTLDTRPLKTAFAASVFERVTTQPEALTYTFPPLDPGAYLVRLRGRGVRTQSTQRTIEAEATARVAFDLLPATTKTPTTKAPTRVGAGTTGPGWYEEVRLNDRLVDAYARWPWPPEGPAPYERVDDLPPDVVNFLDAWGEEVRTRYPDAPVTTDVAVYLDPAYTPDGAPPDAPYAYAVFGEGGAYVPLILAPSTRTLGHPVGVGKSGLFGGDAGIERRLGDVGADEVDVLANAWGGLVQDVTGVGAEAARDIVAGARTAVEALQDDLAQFTGVTPALAAALAGAGFETPADLANASAASILSALGENAGGLTPAWAALLVGEARGAVPASVWSLDAANVDTGLRGALEGVGIRSLGDLERRDAGEIAGTAGVPVDRVREVATEAANARTEAATRVATERAASAPVSSVEGVESSTALALARAGLASTGALAGANAAVVAGALGVDEAAARALVTNARARLGR